MIDKHNLSILRNFIEISEDEISNFQKIWPDNIRVWEYMTQKYLIHNPTADDAQAVQDFIHAYKTIKDPTWPDINSVQDFYCLPEWVTLECRDRHGFHADKWFDTEISYESWQSANITDYPISEVMKQHCIINKNQDILRNKRVIDFPCHYGSMAYWMSKMQLEFLMLADIRPQLLRMAKEHMNLLQWPDRRFSVVQADVHDYENTTNLCREFDTIIFAGILYHLHDHFEVLQAIAKSGIENIIIETAEIGSSIQFDFAQVIWHSEPTERWDAGWYASKDRIPVGVPNAKWITDIMTMLGYRRCRDVVFYPGKHALIRSVHVFEKQ